MESTEDIKCENEKKNAVTDNVIKAGLYLH